MAQSVIVFNSYNEPITDMLVLKRVAGNIAGWSEGPAPPKYTPNALIVPRSRFPVDPPGKVAFAYGNNPMAFPWSSRTGETIVYIDPSISLLDDLILYLTQNRAILLSARGVVLQEFDVISTMTAEQMEAAEKHGH